VSAPRSSTSGQAIWLDPERPVFTRLFAASPGALDSWRAEAILTRVVVRDVRASQPVRTRATRATWPHVANGNSRTTIRRARPLSSAGPVAILFDGSGLEKTRPVASARSPNPDGGSGSHWSPGFSARSSPLGGAPNVVRAKGE